MKYLSRLVLALLVGLLVSPERYHRSTAGDAAQDAGSEHVGRMVSIEGAVDSSVDREVRAALDELQKQAINEDRDAVLVLELHRGPSRFGAVLELATLLTSPDHPRVRTVAWIPEREKVDGYNAILALAANEIIMHPDSELGDIGEGQAVPNHVRQFVLELAEKRHNRKLSPALALGMMDPQTVVKKIKVQTGEQGTETRVVTQKEYQELLDKKTIIPEEDTIKDAGEVGIFTGSKASAEDVLVVRTALSLNELAGIYGVPLKSLRETQTAAGEDLKVALIKITGEIEPVLESFLERQIVRSLERGVNLLIFEIDSPGGRLGPSMNLANRIADLEPGRIKTVAYVPHQAISGAAMIALGCDEIYMHGDALIGDAGVIEARPGQPLQWVQPKVLSIVKATMENLADKQGRPSALLKAMVDKDLVVYRVTHRDNPRRVWYMTEHEIDGSNGTWQKAGKVPESEKDNLLTVNGKRAVDLQLANRVVDDLDDLKAELGIPAGMQLVALGRTWVDTLIFLLNTKFAMFLLLVVGIICLYLELHMMTGLLGIIAALCFSLFFWSRFLGGTAGWLEIVLFVLGLGCIALEIFVMPGFGVFGVSGGLMILGSLVLASQTFGNLEPNRDFQEFSRNMGWLALSIVTVLVLAVAMSRYLPQMPLFRHLVLSPPGAGDAAVLEPRLRPEYVDPVQALIGREGLSISVLRPAGKAQIGDRIYDVVSDGPYIARGTTIEVVSASGNRIVVRAAEE